jgi:hypothetical protein
MECRVIPLGRPEENERLSSLEVLLTNVPSGLSRETLLEVVLLLSQCDLLVAGNTDTFHFAVAMGVPAIGLFHESDPDCWRPRDRALTRVLSLGQDGNVDPEEFLGAIDAVAGERKRAAAITVVSASVPAAAATPPPAPAAAPAAETAAEAAPGTEGNPGPAAAAVRPAATDAPVK